MPPQCVKVARPGFWGNPFRVGVHGTAAECVEAYRLMLTLTGSAWLDHLWKYGIPEELAQGRRSSLPALKGKSLACFCKLSDPCHADVLLELANMESGQ